MNRLRPVELLEEAVRLLRQLVEATQAQPLRGLNDADLLTVEQVARYTHGRSCDAKAWLVARRVTPHIGFGRGKIPLYCVADVRRAMLDDNALVATSEARRRVQARPG